MIMFMVVIIGRVAMLNVLLVRAMAVIVVVIMAVAVAVPMVSQHKEIQRIDQDSDHSQYEHHCMHPCLHSIARNFQCFNWLVLLFSAPWARKLIGLSHSTRRIAS